MVLMSPWRMGAMMRFRASIALSLQWFRMFRI
jgi:hypothetical protein